MRVVKQISFNSSEHADILAWLEKQDNESAAVREALRDKMYISLGDIYNNLRSFEADLFKELKALKASGIIATGPAPLPVDDEEPTDAAAALDNLLGDK